MLRVVAAALIVAAACGDAGTTLEVEGAPFVELREGEPRVLRITGGFTIDELELAVADGDDDHFIELRIGAGPDGAPALIAHPDCSAVPPSGESVRVEAAVSGRGETVPLSFLIVAGSDACLPTVIAWPSTSETCADEPSPPPTGPSLVAFDRGSDQGYCVRALALDPAEPLHLSVTTETPAQTIDADGVGRVTAYVLETERRTGRFTTRADVYDHAPVAGDTPRVTELITVQVGAPGDVTLTTTAGVTAIRELERKTVSARIYRYPDGDAGVLCATAYRDSQTNSRVMRISGSDRFGQDGTITGDGVCFQLSSDVGAEWFDVDVEAQFPQDSAPSEGIIVAANTTELNSLRLEFDVTERVDDVGCPGNANLPQIACVGGPDGGRLLVVTSAGACLYREGADGRLSAPMPLARPGSILAFERATSPTASEPVLIGNLGTDAHVLGTTAWGAIPPYLTGLPPQLTSTRPVRRPGSTGVTHLATWANDASGGHVSFRAIASSPYSLSDPIATAIPNGDGQVDIEIADSNGDGNLELIVGQPVTPTQTFAPTGVAFFRSELTFDAAADTVSAEPFPMTGFTGWSIPDPPRPLMAAVSSSAGELWYASGGSAAAVFRICHACGAPTIFLALGDTTSATTVRSGAAEEFFVGSRLGMHVSRGLGTVWEGRDPVLVAYPPPDGQSVVQGPEYALRLTTCARPTTEPATVAFTTDFNGSTWTVRYARVDDLVTGAPRTPAR